MKISKNKLRKIIMQEIKISIAQQAPVEEELGSAQTYISAAPTSYVASHEATMGQISEDEDEDEDEDEISEGTTLTKSWLRAMVQEAVDDLISSDEEVVEEKKKNWMKDIKSTGECTPYTKPGCKGRARAYAKRAQQGDIHKDNLKKGKNPHGAG